MRAVIVAAGDLDSLPGEVQAVSNTLSAAGWTVRLCIGADATRAGLLAAAGEGALTVRLRLVALRCFDRSSQGLFNSPSAIEAVMNRATTDTKNFRPLSHCQGLAVMAQVATATPVAELLLVCRPATILRAIVAVIVDAINTMIWTRLWPHILNEGQKRFSPTLTNRNPASTVVAISACLRIVASMYHCPIDSVQRVATKTVLRYRRHSSLFAETPTASNVAVTQIGCCCLMLSSAIAKTIPNSVPVFTFDMGEGYDQQTSKSLTGQVFDATRKGCAIMRLHREPPVFSVTWAGTFERRRPTCLFASLLYHKNIYFHCDGTYE